MSTSFTVLRRRRVQPSAGREEAIQEADVAWERLLHSESTGSIECRATRMSTSLPNIAFEEHEAPPPYTRVLSDSLSPFADEHTFPGSDDMERLPPWSQYDTQGVIRNWRNVSWWKMWIKDILAPNVRMPNEFVMP